MPGQTTPPTPADLEAMRLKVREMALQVAETEEQVAATFDRLASSRGDDDGHRATVAAEARKAAAKERQRAGTRGGPADAEPKGDEEHRLRLR